MTSDLQQHSECPTFNKHRSAAFQVRYQVLSVLAPFFGVLFERCEICRVPGACIDLLVLFSLFLNSTLGDKIQLTFSSSLCTISSSFWWHTSGENIDAYGGTNQQQQQQQQVSHCCLPVCLVHVGRNELSLSSVVSLLKMYGIASGCKCFFKKPKLCICGTAFLLYTDIMYQSNRSFNIPLPRATPRAFEFLENCCSNSPLPRPKSCSNAP